MPQHYIPDVNAASVLTNMFPDDTSKERETAGSLATLGMTTRKTRAEAKATADSLRE
jgi:hypothetical protein